jgi:hypothetical protein
MDASGNERRNPKQSNADIPENIQLLDQSRKIRAYIDIHASPLEVNTFLDKGICSILNPAHDLGSHYICVCILARDATFLLAMLKLLTIIYQISARNLPQLSLMLKTSSFLN